MCVCVFVVNRYFLSTSDDFQVKLWDWSRDFENTQLFEGHHHFVMMAQFNPKDPNYFATASLDKTVRVWCLGQQTPNFSLEGHTQGVNCVSYVLSFVPSQSLLLAPCRS